MFSRHAITPPTDSKRPLRACSHSPDWRASTPWFRASSASSACTGWTRDDPWTSPCLRQSTVRGLGWSWPGTSPCRSTEVGESSADGHTRRPPFAIPYVCRLGESTAGFSQTGFATSPSWWPAHQEPRRSTSSCASLAPCVGPWWWGYRVKSWCQPRRLAPMPHPPCRVMPESGKRRGSSSRISTQCSASGWTARRNRWCVPQLPKRGLGRLPTHQTHDEVSHREAECPTLAPPPSRSPPNPSPNPAATSRCHLLQTLSSTSDALMSDSVISAKMPVADEELLTPTSTKP